MVNFHSYVKLPGGIPEIAKGSIVGARNDPVLCALGDVDDVLAAPEELMIRRKVLEPVAW